MTPPLSIRFLGTGGSFGVPEIGCDCDVCTSDDPRDHRTRCAVQIQCGTTSVIVDTPPDFRQQCLTHRITRVDAVLYTHFHADHVMGADDLRRFNRMQGGTLPVYLDAPTRLRFLQTFDYAVDVDHPPHLIRPRFELRDVADGSFQIGELRIRPLTVMHGSEPITGYLFANDRDNARIAYLTDCKTLPPETVTAVTGADVIVLSALWQEWDHASHLNLPQALELAKILRPKHLFLTHVTHRMGRYADVQPTLPPTCALAFDGLQRST